MEKIRKLGKQKNERTAVALVDMNEKLENRKYTFVEKCQLNVSKQENSIQ